MYPTKLRSESLTNEKLATPTHNYHRLAERFLVTNESNGILNTANLARRHHPHESSLKARPRNHEQQHRFPTPKHTPRTRTQQERMARSKLAYLEWNR